MLGAHVFMYLHNSYSNRRNHNERGTFQFRDPRYDAA